MQQGPSNPSPSAISLTSQPPMALDYGMFVKAAYDVFDKYPNELNPSQDQYPTFPTGFKLLLNLQMSDFFGDSSTPKYYGFIAQGDATNPDVTIVAFRGTQTAEEWWDDFHWELVPFTDMPNGGNVAQGFLDIYQTLSATFPESQEPPRPLKEVVSAENPVPNVNLDSDATFVITGHSLGSSLATLYAADLASKVKFKPVVYTFASPRVGDDAFVTAYNALIETNYRIYNWPDLVPRFPREIFDPTDNYEQVKGGYMIDSLLSPDVKWTIECFHSCSTYLFMLGAPVSILGGTGEDGCQSAYLLENNSSSS